MTVREHDLETNDVREAARLIAEGMLMKPERIEVYMPEASISVDLTAMFSSQCAVVGILPADAQSTPLCVSRSATCEHLNVAANVRELLRMMARDMELSAARAMRCAGTLLRTAKEYEEAEA